MVSTFVLSTSTVSAGQDVCTWTGAASGDTNNAANWSGCDNSTLPEDGDDLSFPASPTTTNITWNSTVTPRHITVDDSDYVFGGTQIILSGTLNVFADVTFGSTIIFQNATGQTGLNVQSASIPTFSSGMTYNVTGTGFGRIFTTNSTLNLPALTGVAPNFYIAGNPSVSNRVFNLASGGTLTVSGTMYVRDANVVCASSDCFGNANNAITLESASAGYSSFIHVNTPSFSYDVTANDFANPGNGRGLRIMQNATLSGDFTTTTTARVDIDSGVTATFSGTINNNAIIDVNGAGSASSRAIFSGDTTGSSQIALTNVTGLFNGTNSNVSSYVYLFSDSVVGGTGTALGGIHAAAANASTIAPGTSPGCLSSSYYTGNSLSSFAVEIAGTIACSGYDRLTLSGAATLNNVGFTLSATGGPYAAGTVFTIIQAGSVAGTFSGLADGATVTAGGQNFRINYTATAVTLTALATTTTTTTSDTESLVDAGTALPAILLAAGTLSILALSTLKVRTRKAYSAISHAPRR